jgi:peptidoglycan/xylan/chitin deacetylase (PgdA/CDA1 family)
MIDLYAKKWKEAVKRKGSPNSYMRSFFKDAYININLIFKGERSSKDNFLKLIYCHYVFDDQIEGFEKIIDKLSNNGEFISTDRCIKILSGKEKLKGRFYHLSFDDGFRNVYTNAAPILNKRKIPALFFIPSGFIGASFKEVECYCLDILNMKKAVELVSWSDLKNMMSMGFDIGSHTRYHARLSDISNSSKTMDSEIRKSKEDIELNLDIDCKYFSWPFGTDNDKDKASISFVEKSGYSACFSAIRGDATPISESLFEIPRNHFECQWPLTHIKYFLLD